MSHSLAPARPRATRRDNRPATMVSNAYARTRAAESLGLARDGATGGVSGVLTCLACSSHAPDGARFCPSCGTEFTGTLAEERRVVTVLFADIVGFTVLSSSMSPHAVVSMLDGLFSDFDDLVGARHLEKIKTIGDAYMVAGGLDDRADYDDCIGFRRRFTTPSARFSHPHPTAVGDTSRTGGRTARE